MGEADTAHLRFSSKTTRYPLVQGRAKENTPCLYARLFFAKN